MLRSWRESPGATERAFELLHKKFSGLVFATAYRVLNDPHDAEEVAQEVFSGVWNKSRLYDPLRGKPQVWLSTMARNRAIDRLRSKQRRAQLRDELSGKADSRRRSFGRRSHR